MKNIYFVIIITFSSLLASAQAGEWVWIHGSSSRSSPGNHGVKGVPGATVEPPATYEACEWTDKNGNFWIYGGQDSTGSFHNDLFKFDPVADEWEWVSGTDTPGDQGVYGIQGVPSATNRPPCRGWAPASWTDTTGNLWMFGGYNGGDCNDLWMYNIATNIWTWMKGPNTSGSTGMYGTQGVPSINNVPGSRHEGCAAWTDNAGDLWIFGGYTFSGSYNDMCRYNIATNTWTWIKGSNTYGQLTTYGTMGTEAPSNTPGNRLAYCRWKDQSGNLWFFGGWEISASKLHSDLWRFNPLTHNWAWMNGDTLGNATSVFGSKCTAATTNQPGARYEDRAAWTDGNGNLWMYGGATSGLSNLMSDLWMYCISKNEWVWESGDTAFNYTGNYGLINIPSPTNMPGGKAGAQAWTDKNGHLYLFGGSGSSGVTPYNDLWKYTIDPVCAACATVLPPVADFNSSDSTLCTNDCISFNNLSINATSYQWTFQGGTPPTDTSANPQFVCYLTSGTFDVTLVATNSGGSDTIKATKLISVMDSPPTPVINQDGNTLYCTTDTSYISYQWFDSTAIIQGATDTALNINHPGNYNVQVTNRNGCQIAVGITVVLGLQKSVINDFQFTVSPNPVRDELIVRGNWRPENGSLKLTVYNILGQQQYSGIINSKSETLNCKTFSSGVYFIEVQNEKQKWVTRFVKE